ncbi:MAG TPA: TetR/AcrR family transcriptional regulator [Polyangia bacterium]
MSRRPNARQRMIDAAIDLFHSQGVNATSIDDVLARSRTGKGQFSHYFKLKHGLVHAVLAHLHHLIESGDSPTGYDVRTWRELDHWFDQYIAFQRATACTRSCPVGTIGADITGEDDLLRQDVRLFLQWSRGRLARFFAERVGAGELAPSTDTESLADFCIAIMQGGMLLAKMKRDTDMFEGAAAHARAYLRSLRIRSRHG